MSRRNWTLSAFTLIWTGMDVYFAITLGGWWRWGLAGVQAVITFILIRLYLVIDAIEAETKRLMDENEFWETVLDGYEIEWRKDIGERP